MGEEIPPEPPPEYGLDCLTCWSEGETPRKIRATFSGMILCPGIGPPDWPNPPNGVVFTCWQREYNPCYFVYGSSPGWVARYQAVIPGVCKSGVDLYYYRPDGFFKPYFGNYVSGNPPCKKTFNNTTTCEGGAAAHSGTCVIE